MRNSSLDYYNKNVIQRIMDKEALIKSEFILFKKAPSGAM